MSFEVCFSASSEADTDFLGALLASRCWPGMTVALVGNLGAGKTRLVRAIATGLGVNPLCVGSPTFGLIHEYEGRLPVYHFDAYRLRNVAEFLELGVEELLSGDGVCLIEWADQVSEVLPRDHLRIEIEHSGATSRKFRITATGEPCRRLIDELTTELDRPRE